MLVKHNKESIADKRASENLAASVDKNTSINEYIALISGIDIGDEEEITNEQSLKKKKKELRKGILERLHDSRACRQRDSYDITI